MPVFGGGMPIPVSKSSNPKSAAAQPAPDRDEDMAPSEPPAEEVMSSGSGRRSAGDVAMQRGGGGGAPQEAPQPDSDGATGATAIYPTDGPSRPPAKSLRRKEAVLLDDDDPRAVRVHVYHTDPVTAWLNWAGLKYAEVPIYHAGVEVYGIEWAFQYFDDAWDDEDISGVVCCEPKQMTGFEYQHSVSMGTTGLSSAEVRRLLEKLRHEWPASSYHLTRHNCLTFAQVLIGELRVPEPFPSFLEGFGYAPKYIPVTDAVVDFGWSWYKWGMKRSSAAARAQEEREEEEVRAASSTSCFRPPSVADGPTGEFRMTETHRPSSAAAGATTDMKL